MRTGQTHPQPKIGSVNSSFSPRSNEENRLEKIGRLKKNKGERVRGAMKGGNGGREDKRY